MTKVALAPMTQSIVVFYRDLHEKAARMMRESTLQPGSIFVDGLGIQERMEPCMISRPAGTDGYLLMAFNDPAVIHDLLQPAAANLTDQFFGSEGFFTRSTPDIDTPCIQH